MRFLFIEKRMFRKIEDNLPKYTKAVTFNKFF